MRYGLASVFTVTLFSISMFAFAFAEASFRMPSSEWRTRMVREFIKEMCEPQGYVLNCYDVKPSRCRSSVRVEFTGCIKQHRVPAQINPYSEGISISYRTGQCVGHKLDEKFKNKKKSDSRCKSEKAWL